MELYTKTTYGCSRLITQAYSTSFTLGIKTLDRKFHQPVYAIYGFVRLADEIVDTFHEYDKCSLIQQFEQDTWKAIREGISLNPVLNAFQDVVNRYLIDQKLIEAFLESMKMDLDHTFYNQEKFDTYVHGSAEVVGLMCLRVFCGSESELYDSLEGSARKLGSAFQKVNFLRDIQSDYNERGRVYFPQMKNGSFNGILKKQIESDIEKDFKQGLEGIRKLPKGARFGVYVAYVYYWQLFNKIREKSPHEVMNGRIRVPNGKKALLLFQSYLKERLNWV